MPVAGAAAAVLFGLGLSELPASTNDFLSLGRREERRLLKSSLWMRSFKTSIGEPLASGSFTPRCLRWALA